MFRQEIENEWGLPKSQATMFVLYFGYATPTFASPYLKEVFAMGGDMFTSRSVDRWVFNTSDPLLLIASPTTPQLANLIQNQTSEAESLATVPASTLYTGLNNNQLVSRYRCPFFIALVY